MTRYIPTVAPELLIKANNKAAEDREKRGSGDPLVSVVLVLAGKHEPEEIIAVSYRLRALASLLQGGVGEPWTASVAGKEYTLVSETLFRAAARTPLSEGKTVGDVQFDREEFLKIALEEAEPEGSS